MLMRMGMTPISTEELFERFITRADDTRLPWDQNGRATILECRVGSSVAYLTPHVLRVAPLSLRGSIGYLMRNKLIAVTKLNVTRDELIMMTLMKGDGT